MLLNINKLSGCTVHAIDGEAGEIKSAYFSGKRWEIRYFVVDTGGIFTSHKVLLPPAAFSPRDASWKDADMRMTKEQVQKSPTEKVDLMVSRATEQGALDYSSVPGYRETGTKKGTIRIVNTTFGIEYRIREIAGAQYLYNTRDLQKYCFQPADGEAGRLTDFFVDDRSWYLHYALTDASRLLPVELIDTIDEEDHIVLAGVSNEVLMHSPFYDPDRPIEGPYEKALFSYYGQRVTPYARWSFENRRAAMPPERRLRLAVQSPAIVHWSADDWKTVNETKTRDTGRGIYIADLATEKTTAGSTVVFTFFWLGVKRWEGKNFYVHVQSGARAPVLAGV